MDLDPTHHRELAVAAILDDLLATGNIDECYTVLGDVFSMTGREAVAVYTRWNRERIAENHLIMDTARNGQVDEEIQHRLNRWEGVNSNGGKQ